MKTLSIDEEEMAMALQSRSYEARHFLDLETGEIVFCPDDLSALPDEDIAHQIEEDQSGRFKLIDSLASHDAYEIMRGFVSDHVQDTKALRALERALAGKSPFRKFKDALFEFPDLREQWFRYELAELKRHAEQWLANIDVSPIWTSARGSG